MNLPSFNLHQPATLPQALDLASSLGSGARFLAGGSDLLARLKLGTSQATDLISLAAVTELRRIDGLEIGGCVSLQALVDDPDIQRRFPALAQAAQSVGSVQVRNQATLAGNLCQDTRCWHFNRSQRLAQAKPGCRKRGGGECLVVPASERCFAAYQGDTAAALLALGAEAVLHRKGENRRIGLADLFLDAGDRNLDLAPGELLSRVILPDLPPESRSGYRKFRLRSGIDFPLAGVALNLLPPDSQAPYGELRVGLTGLSSRPLLLVLEGGISAEELGEVVRQAAHPVNNVGGLAWHRRYMAGQMAKDLWKELQDEAGN